MTDEAPRRRSALVTAAAWLLVAGSAPLLPVSLITLLMFLAGSEGTRSATLLGAVAVVGGPPAALLVGLGLWRRWRWAWAGALPLLAGIALWGVAESLRRPVPARTWVTPEGVLTHVAATGAAGPLPIVATIAALGVLGLLLTPRVRREFVALRGATGARRVAAAAQAASRPRADDGSDEARGWRVGHVGRDETYYEELRDGRWERIRIGGEMLTGRAHHVIYFASPREWLAHPAWARHRRDEIVARVRSAFRPPDYEYAGDGAGGTGAGTAPDAAGGAPPAAAHAAHATRPTTSDARRAPGPSLPASQRAALLGAVALLLLVSAAMAWLVGHGLADGATWLPAARATQRRVLLRAEEPFAFWVSLVLYAAIGGATFGLAAWGFREGLRSRDR